MFFMSNSSEESHVKTFCFTRTLSRYTRAPGLVGLKRPPTEGLATWEPWSWGQICRWTGLCQPAPNTWYHQSPLRTRTAPDLQREIYKDELERPEEAHGPSLFPPIQSQRLAVMSSWSYSEAQPDFPRWIIENTVRDTYLDYIRSHGTLVYDSWLYKIVTVHMESTYLFYMPSLFSLLYLMVYVKLQFKVVFSNAEAKLPTCLNFLYSESRSQKEFRFQLSIK